ncbi:hypothetical protein ACFOWX_11255 [Sphingorhabdus arenilitoris]|uniref:Uncharacterized protein n=1 Tax=Sphingorhabdus arenilitoris TaxID=1490041 RepID=A0ABV8RKG1_9SPHN
MKILLALSSALFMSAANANSLPEGWTEQQNNGMTLYENGKELSSILATETILNDGTTFADYEIGIRQLLSQGTGCKGLDEAETTPLFNNRAMVAKVNITGPNGKAITCISMTGFQDKKFFTKLLISDPAYAAKGAKLMADLMTRDLGLGAGQPVIAAEAPQTPNANNSRNPKTITANVDSLRFFYFAGGPGGVDPRPVVLFKGGLLCDCAEYALGTANPEIYRSKYPGDFGKWRRTAAGEYEVLWDEDSSGNWSGLSSSAAKPLPAAWRGQGTWRRTSSVGMLGGDAPVTSSINLLTFNLDGRFSEGNVISSTSPTVFAGGSSAEREGRYDIDGYFIVLRYDDGATERMSAVWESDEDVIWFDGKGFIR